MTIEKISETPLFKQVTASVIGVLLSGSLLWFASSSIDTRDSVIQLKAELPAMITNAVNEAVKDRYTSKDADHRDTIVNLKFAENDRTVEDHETRLRLLESVTATP